MALRCYCPVLVTLRRFRINRSYGRRKKKPEEAERRNEDANTRVDDFRQYGEAAEARYPATRDLIRIPIAIKKDLHLISIVKKRKVRLVCAFIRISATKMLRGTAYA